MAYYVTATDNVRSVRVVGPFRTHGEALNAEPIARSFCATRCKDGVFAAYGTAHDRTTHQPARMNAHLVSTVDAEGFVTCLKEGQ